MENIRNAHKDIQMESIYTNKWSMLHGRLKEDTRIDNSWVAKLFMSKKYTFYESYICDLNCIDKNIVYLNSFLTVSFSFARN